MDINIVFHELGLANDIDWPAWMSAIATIVAVFIALFGKLFWDWFYRPRLAIDIANRAPFCVVVRQRFFEELSEEKRACPFCANNAPFVSSANNSITFGSSLSLCADNALDDMQNDQELEIFNPDSHACKALYLRLKVVNYGRKSPAESVEVFVHRIIPIRDGKEGTPIDIAMNLKWSNVGGMFYPQIPAKSEKFCDIGFVTCPDCRDKDPRYVAKSKATSNGYDKNDPAFCVNVTHPLLNEDHILGPGQYKIEVTVFAAGSKPIKGVISILFSDWPKNSDDSAVCEMITDCAIKPECGFDIIPSCTRWRHKIFKIYTEILPSGN